MTWRGDSLHDLTAALRALRGAVAEAAFPLNLRSAERARADGAALVQQIDDYLMPRLLRPEAPLLAAVGGSTGAGKSTLVNSLARAPVSTAGVIRPTTRSPVLICHPTDAAWFRNGARLGGFTRTGGHTTDPYRLQLVVAPALPPGLALLDTPDIDSVVDTHREVATQLLAAADLWLFVTTASRYADAVPWEMLGTARARGSVVAVVLNRVPHHAGEEVTVHLSQMLGAEGFVGSPLFVVPETWADRQGMLPEPVTAQLRGWLDALAADEPARAAVIGLTLDGALAALPAGAETLAQAADEQFVVAEVLAEQVGLAYGTARSTVEHGIRSGTMLRGEVLARWEELSRTGEWARVVEAASETGPEMADQGRSRDRAGAEAGRSVVGQELRAALASALVTLVRSAAADAAEAVDMAWRGQAELVGPPPDPTSALEQLAYHWQRGLLDLVRLELARIGDRPLGTYPVNATALLVMIGTFASATAGGTAAITGHEALASALTDPVVRELAGRARSDLVERIGMLLDDEAASYLERLAGVPLDGGPAKRLRQAATDLARARVAAGLVTSAAGSAGGEAAAGTVPLTQAPGTPPDGYPDGHTGHAGADPGGPAAAWAGQLAARQEAGR